MEWSDDGLHFTKIAVVQAAGNSTQDLHYSYLHKMPVDGNNYYRLKMRDIDGRFTYSPVIKVTATVNALSITVFPNPVADVLQLHLVAVKNEIISLTLHSADGKIISSKAVELVKGTNHLHWNMHHLPTGNYFLAGSGFKTIKITKK